VDVVGVDEDKEPFGRIRFGNPGIRRGERLPEAQPAVVEVRETPVEAEAFREKATRRETGGPEADRS
jgi:hypothetical protein